jgi:hypothetical protein
MYISVCFSESVLKSIDSFVVLGWMTEEVHIKEVGYHAVFTFI